MMNDFEASVTNLQICSYLCKQFLLEFPTLKCRKNKLFRFINNLIKKVDHHNQTLNLLCAFQLTKCAVLHYFRTHQNEAPSLNHLPHLQLPQLLCTLVHSFEYICPNLTFGLDCSKEFGSACVESIQCFRNQFKNYSIETLHQISLNSLYEHIRSLDTCDPKTPDGKATSIASAFSLQFTKTPPSECRSDMINLGEMFSSQTTKNNSCHTDINISNQVLVDDSKAFPPFFQIFEKYKFDGFSSPNSLEEKQYRIEEINSENSRRKRDRPSVESDLQTLRAKNDYPSCAASALENNFLTKFQRDIESLARLGFKSVSPRIVTIPSEIQSQISQDLDPTNIAVRSSLFQNCFHHFKPNSTQSEYSPRNLRLHQTKF